jgi:anti-sigma B factor antagonist
MTRAKAAKPSVGATRLSVEGELTIYRAVDLKRVLIEPLEQRVALDVDLSKVTELDTAGVQLLLLVQRAAEANEVELRFLEHSPAVKEVLELMGLSTSLGVPAPSASMQAPASSRGAV